MTEKKARIENIIFRNSGNGYTIALVETENEQFTAVGCIPACDRGRTFIFRGDFSTHPKYGEQFVFSDCEEILPSAEEDIETFLASGVLKGIGPKTAASIVRKFGEDTFEIIEKFPERLTEISGIGEKKACAVGETFRANKEFAETALYFRQFGIDSSYAMRMYKVYGSATLETVKEDPYCLIHDVLGINFKKADSIAEKMGVKKDDRSRIRNGIIYTLRYFAGEGSTFVPQKELCEKAAALMDLDSFVISDMITDMAFDGEVRVEELEGRNVVFLMIYYEAEQNICRSLRDLNEAFLKPVNAEINSLISAVEKEAGLIFSEAQKQAIKDTIKNGVSVITGGPGTGKTTIINGITGALKQSGLSTAIAAPTGRAAKRITEATDYPASTIHRLLEYSYSEDEDIMRFGRNSENPLEYDAVIVDEASMIDILLMEALVMSLRPGTRLIIAGDADQLPPVGAGNVLRDIIESELIYSVKLKEIFRQARESLIVVNAHRINRGEYPQFNEKDKDFFLIRRSDERSILAAILELCGTRLPGYYRNCDPVRDIQVLTPVRRGMLGTMNLNRELQKILNPSGAGKKEKNFGEKIFREKDKVMQIRNNYGLKWKNTEDFSEGEGVFNGDIGFIDDIDDENNRISVIFDDSRYVNYEFSETDELEPAYAVTVHKSQGSEFPIIIMPVSALPPVLATRNLLYTAVTRGKETVVLAGSEQRMQAMIDNNSIKERYSGLKARLRKMMEDERNIR